MGVPKKMDLSSTAVVGIGRTAYTRRSGRTGIALAAEAVRNALDDAGLTSACLLYTSPSPRDRTRSRMPSSA